jgi:hypothetical protein
VIIFTLILDKVPHSEIWDIAYHVFLNNKSHQTLVDHCAKLVQCSIDITAWKSSSYGRCIDMCTQYTLSELRRHWVLYSEFSKLPKEKIQSYKDAFFDTRIKLEDIDFLFSSARSAGPLIIQATDILSKQFTKYSESGLCTTRARDTSRATSMNPTFIYSLVGDTSSAHYASDPLVSFHHSPLFGNAKGTVTVSDTIQNAKSEFASWCTATSAAFSEDRACVRFFLGEANSACYALKLQYLLCEEGSALHFRCY